MDFKYVSEEVSFKLSEIRWIERQGNKVEVHLKGGGSVVLNRDNIDQTLATYAQLIKHHEVYKSGGISRQ